MNPAQANKINEEKVRIHEMLAKRNNIIYGVITLLFAIGMTLIIILGE